MLTRVARKALTYITRLNYTHYAIVALLAIIAIVPAPSEYHSSWTNSLGFKQEHQSSVRSKPVPRTVNSTDPAQRACTTLQNQFPSIIGAAGSTQFNDNIAHWAMSSTQQAACTIEPETEEDVSRVIKVIGDPSIRAPFAIKSGGHAYNLGFSSTPGVLVSLSRFRQFDYNSSKSTVKLGVGLTWDEVYDLLDPLGIMVTGGRTPGIGVGGLSLGGGYSWKTNQFGLTIDTITSFSVVLPTGSIQSSVTNETNPDLFFALKGGMNNFGIVTAIEFEVHSQGLIWGGSVIYSSDMIQRVHSATEDFSENNTDPKAQIIVTYADISGMLIAQIIPFYDGPSPPAGVFDDFLAISSMSNSIKTRTFVDFISQTFQGGDLGIGPFGIAQHDIPIAHYSLPILEEIITQITNASAQLRANPATNGTISIVSISPEPFLKPFAHSKGGAYPHPSTREVTPASPFIAYQLDPSVISDLSALNSQHQIYVDALKAMTDAVQAVAVEAGQSRWDDILYPNYALADTPLELLYGGNLPRLKALARQFDPENVMSLTGGFRLGV